MLTAIRRDTRALASPRVIATLEQWRAALANADPIERQLARRRLLAVSQALLGAPKLVEDFVRPAPADADAEAFTVDAYQRPTVTPTPPPQDAVPRSSPRQLRAERPEPAGPASSDRNPAVSPDFVEEGEPSTSHIPLAAEGDDDEAGTVDAMPPRELLRAAAAAGEKSTTHIPLKSLNEPLQHVPPVRALSNLPAEEKAILESAGPTALDEGDVSAPSRLAPKPGIIRRRSAVRRPSAPRRPRAAMHHVRSLYAVLMPFAEELVPLAFERRSRRFWARWREVAGDHGVRRPFVEELLRTATDARTLVCELIAEVQSVDTASVAALVEQLSVAGRDGGGDARPPVRASGPTSEA